MSFHKIREQSHKNHKARVHRASGGHTDAAEDRSMIKSMVKPSALNRAKGGAAHKPHKPKSGKTSVNVVVAPERGASAAPAGMGGAGLSRAPVPPVIPGGLGGVGAGPAPTGPGGPVGPRPGGLKKGGRAHRASGGRTYHAGAATGEGRLEKKDKYGK